MPQRSQPGERRGGRQAGVPNKATVEAQERARLAAEIATSMSRPLTQPAPAGAPAPVQRKLMRERLEELAEICIGAAAFFQPAAQGQRPNPHENWGEFHKWVETAIKAADKAADYQSPKYRAIAVASAAPEPKQVGKGDGNVIPINDPVAAARVYRRIVSASSGGR